MNRDWLLIITSLLTFLSPGLYGTLGAVGFYTFKVVKENGVFSWYSAILYGFLGLVVGFIVHDMSLFLLKASYPGLIIAAGFSVNRIAEIAERFLKLTITK